ncbi:helix-turn-helix domain-containing protein [Lactobacillus mulieris]|uniref:Helix-turn-helix domain-containing protein n=1 Tax=Lactobacillus mulieris TaxID=2508708 RepID=A0AAW5WW56_9LACO|nr:helix-turn-helix transcriptional regulator [Lactobacillus mulieris]MCZ3621915.1 helix-turn-helix domain-containing protein [Lactobacillus mulieris]MCZ3623612.1 helix-turn-helix domain-containing protein [Lactobacillus mulieris]MCZ3635922.1 helix-turn-helix domain-containing protein [Lactobacillus mulieris]MCZ3689652.1 helix-turn-helix domain-containing protein [Lactobacillus mulieris]MCZ3695655.1 helix-turn-helix domain-containing protein [Lactobacillus mulieris]
MTIGDLLKEYRIEQGKYQKEFTNDGQIVSQSFYSKVEKNVNRITADSLLELLHYNKISLWEFFSRLNQSDDFMHQQTQSFHKILIEAYYANDKAKIKQLKPIIKESYLSDKGKEEELLLVEAVLELMKDPSEEPNLELRKKIKEKIFNIPSFNQAKMELFCNFMYFYDFESNKIIAQRIIKQYISTNDIELQKPLLGIIINILALSFDAGKEKTETEFFIESAKKIKMHPELTFGKLALLFYTNLINYRKTGQQKYYKQSSDIADTMILVGITGYGKILHDLLVKYK